MRSLTENEAVDLVRSNGGDEALAVLAEQGELSLQRFKSKGIVTVREQCEWSFCQTAFNLLSSITLPPPPTDKA